MLNHVYQSFQSLQDTEEDVVEASVDVAVPLF